MRRCEGFFEAADAERFRERLVAAFGEEIDLVAQIFQVVVDRRRGEEQDFGPNAGLDDVVHQPLVAAFPDEVAGFVALAGRVVAEVVRLVDDNEIVVAPVERLEVDVAGIAALAAQVGVGKNVVTEAVVQERIEQAVGLVNGPVVAKLLRAENKDAFILQLEVFDDGEGFVGFSQADAVGNDAAVVAENLVDGPFRTILLKLEQRFPDLRFKKAGLPSSASVLPVSPRNFSKMWKRVL